MASIHWLWFAGCVIFVLSKLYTLLFLRDVLTQSLLLLTDTLLISIALLKPKYTVQVLE